MGLQFRIRGLSQKGCRIIKWHFLFIFLLFLLGCSPLEIGRIIGIGTRPFKEQGKVYTRIFPKNVSSSYEQILQALAELESYIYRGSLKKNFIVATHFKSSFKRCTDSTEVAVFFKELEPAQTEVRVSSLNYSLADFAAKRLFEDFEADKKGEGQ